MSDSWCTCGPQFYTVHNLYFRLGKGLQNLRAGMSNTSDTNGEYDCAPVNFVIIATLVVIALAIANVVSVRGLSDTLKSINIMPHVAAEAFIVVWGVVGAVALLLLVVFVAIRSHRYLWRSAAGVGIASLIGAVLNWIIMIIILMSI